MSNDLSSRLKSLRENRGIAQKFVAEKIGIKANTLSGYENGARQPDPETLKKLADFYEVTTDYLLGRSDTPSFSKSTESLIRDIDFAMRFEDLKKKYKFMLDGVEISEKDIEDVLNVVKIVLSRKK